MVIILSDLHFQDATSNGPSNYADANVEPAAFDHLWKQIESLGERAGATEPPTVVLNGDILELLRAERWFEEETRPYNFAGPPLPETLATAARIGHAILDQNAPALAALRGRGPARFVYVYGNHDRLLREPALEPVRRRLAELLGGEVRFVDVFTDERRHLHVGHGHELDWTCSEYQHARSYDGISSDDPAHLRLAPLGDWVGLDIGARLPHLAWQMLSSNDRRFADIPPPLRRELHARLLYLDDMRPQTEVLRWLVRPGGLDGLTRRASEIAAVARFLGDLMNALITKAMPLIEPWLDAHGRPLFDRLALAAVSLLGSTKYTASTLPAVMERIHRYLSGQDRPWQVLPRTALFQDERFTCFAHGHTHEPGVLPLRGAGGLGDLTDGAKAGWYLNTGTWRKTILRSPVDSEIYGAVKQIAYAVVYDEEESARGGGRRGVTFDLWQAASQRF